MASTFAFDQLSEDTILEIAPKAVGLVEEDENPEDLVKELIRETQDQGIKELAFMMKSLELKDICDKHLHVEYKQGANKNNKMMLTKRFMESFEDKTLEEWFSEVENKEIFKLICKVMDIDMTKKSTDKIRAELIQQIYSIGTEIVFHRMTVPQLKKVCEDMKIDGFENTSSKRVLVDAILTQTDIEKTNAAPKTKVIDTEKLPIGKCTEIDELDQHYSVKKLQEWANKNHVKSAGTKAVLMERILAFNGGDKENTMVDPSKIKEKKTTKKADGEEKEDSKAKKTTKKPLAEKTTEKKVTKKAAEKTTKKVTKKEAEKEKETEEKEQEEEEQQEEEQPKAKETKKQAAKSAKNKKEEKAKEVEEKEKEASEEYDAEAEKAAVDAERGLRTTEEQSESELSDSLPLTGKVVAISGDFTRTQTEMIEVIVKLGGVAKTKLVKGVHILVLGENGKGKSAATKNGIEVVDEAHLDDLLTKM